MARKATTEIRKGDKINIGGEVVTVMAHRHDVADGSLEFKIAEFEIIKFSDTEDLEVV